MTIKRPTILIAGGGTGGHVFPGLAVADALQKLADVDVVFVGTRRGLEQRVVPARGYALELLDVEPMKGGGVARALRGALVATRAMRRATQLITRLSPHALLSVGGYAAGPVSLAAALAGVPMTVFEPNSTVGLTNRLLAPWAKRAYVTWDETAARFRPSAVRMLGVPLRPGFSPKPYVASGTARVLVMGGSQGAQALNERLPEAMARVAREVPDLEVLHQAGRDRDQGVRAAYARDSVSVTVASFLDDVPREIARADLIIARAGAVTVAEIAAIGRASILIPFPFAADDHQAKNAMALADRRGAMALRQEAADPSRIALEVSRLLRDDAARVAMADAARARGRAGASLDVALDILELAHIPLRSSSFRNGSRDSNGSKTTRSEVS